MQEPGEETEPALERTPSQRRQDLKRQSEQWAAEHNGHIDEGRGGDVQSAMQLPNTRHNTLRDQAKHDIWQRLVAMV